MPDVFNDLSSLLSVLSDKKAYGAMLDKLKSAKEENDAALAKLEETKSGMANRLHQLDKHKDEVAEIEKSANMKIRQSEQLKESLAVDIQRHKEAVVEYQRERQEFQARMANLVQREGSLIERDAVLKIREDKIEKAEADLSRRMSALRAAVA